MSESTLCVRDMLAEYLGEENVKSLGENRIWVRATRSEEYSIALACVTYNASVSSEAKVRFELELVFPPVFVEPAHVKTDTVLCLGQTTDCQFAATLDDAFHVQPAPYCPTIPASLVPQRQVIAGRHAIRAGVAFLLGLGLAFGLALKGVYLPVMSIIVCASLFLVCVDQARKAMQALTGPVPMFFDGDSDDDDDEEEGEQ